MGRLVGLNEKGMRVGEDHQRAVLTNAEVERMRELHEEGFGYKKLAAMFEVSPSLVAKICRYQSRAQIACRWKTVNG